MNLKEGFNFFVILNIYLGAFVSLFLSRTHLFHNFESQLEEQSY